MSGPVMPGDAIAVVVNGKSEQIAEGTTLAAMLGALGIATLGVAVAVNERVVRASAHAEHELHAGDVIEIVRAASGG